MNSDIMSFAAYLRKEERSAATIEKYVREAGRFLRWLDGRTAGKELALAYKEALMGERTPAGVNGAVAALNCLFSFWGLPECRMRSVKIQRRIFRDEERELTEKEYRRLLAAAKGNRRLLLVMETICATGIRVSEVRYITVEAARAGRTDVTLKGKVRTLLLPAKLCRKLLKYAKAQKTASGEIFVTKSGRGLSRGQIWQEMKSLCALAGVEPSKVFPHNLRHLFATVYYRACRDIVKLADILGHSSINTTRIYLQTTGAEHARQLEQLRLVT